VNYAFIGDIHSQYQLLDKALEHCAQEELTPVLLGDLFDSHHANSGNAQSTLEMVKEAQSVLGAVVLQSNHQDKLIRYLKGNNVAMRPDFQRTVDDLGISDRSSATSQELRNWLESLPYGIVFRDSRGLEYRAAHAFFSSKVQIPSYCRRFLVRELNKEMRHYFLYGPIVRREGERARLNWWEEEKQQNFRRVAGHYHVLHESRYSLVLDGECGGSGQSPLRPTDGFLPLYDVERQAVIRFSQAY